MYAKSCTTTDNTVPSREFALNIANQVSLLRLVIAIPIFILLLHPRHPLLPCLLFILAGLSDILDGWLARKLGYVSKLGKLLDPLADKILIVGIMIIMATQHIISVWLVIIMIARELAISSLRGAAAQEGVIVAASFLGKLKTASQFIAIFMLMYEPQWHAIGNATLWLATVLSLVSALQYFRQQGNLIDQ